MKAKTLKNFLLIFVSTLSYPYSLALKGIYSHPRPETAIVTVNSPMDIYSFPSTHVTFYTAFFGFIFYLTVISRIDPFLKKMVQIFCLLLILYIGYSRVSMGFHRPLDVVGGYFYGGLFLTTLVVVDHKVTRILPKNKNKNN